MIVEWVLAGLAGLVTALASLWPWEGGDPSSSWSSASAPSSWLPNLNSYVPVALIATVVVGLLALRAGVLVYRALLHAYSLVPFV